MIGCERHVPHPISRGHGGSPWYPFSAANRVGIPERCRGVQKVGHEGRSWTRLCYARKGFPSWSGVLYNTPSARRCLRSGPLPENVPFANNALSDHFSRTWTPNYPLLVPVVTRSIESREESALLTGRLSLETTLHQIRQGIPTGLSRSSGNTLISGFRKSWKFSRDFSPTTLPSGC
jgi:hypothetical protein